MQEENMNKIEFKYEYTPKQYRRDGFGQSCYFVDIYLNTYLHDSIMTGQPLSDDELKCFVNVVIARGKNKDNLSFEDPLEKRMDELLLAGKSNLAALECSLAAKMGQERFDTHYEKSRYYLMYLWGEDQCELPETFWVSERNYPLKCLKMAHLMGKKTGKPYRILLSDKKTEIDPELLAFALSEK